MLGNLGLVYAALGRPADALFSCQAMLKVALAIGDARILGQCLGHLGLAQARLLDFSTARASLAEGQAILQQINDPLSLGLLQCQRAESEWLSGDVVAAEQARTSAVNLGAASGAGPSSELGLALARLESLLSGSSV